MPAETDAPPTQAPAGEDEPRRGRRSLRRPTRPELLRWAGDTISLVILAAVLLWWEMHDGGRNRPQLVVVSAMCLLAAPVLISETRRLAPSVRWLLAAYGLGWLVAVGFAVDRHDWVASLLVYGTVPAVGLVTRRIWRRPWGPTVVLTLLLVAFGRYTFRSWLQWWGYTMWEGAQPLWMPLSWHNQAGTLSGAFGLFLLGVAWSGRRVVRLGFALLSGTAFAGVWLSSSRGAVAFTAATAVVMLVVGVRSFHRRSDRIAIALTSGGVAVVAVAMSTLLMSMLAAGGSPAPLDSRDESAAGNAVARINHMQAALRMFADRPLVGQGPGSYELVALNFTDPDANLTSSAHDEYVEVLGEGGLAAGFPFLLLHIAVGVLVWRRLRYGVVLTDDSLVDLRGAMNLGLVGIVVLVATHSSFDFDWDYPVLPSLLAMGAAALSVRPGDVDFAPEPSSPAAPAPSSGWSRWAAVPLVLLLTVAVAGHVIERRWSAPAEDLSAESYAAYGAPWDAELRSAIAANLLGDGKLELARSVVDDALVWNPGDDRLRRIRAMVRFEQGELDARGLVDTLEEGRSRFTSYLDVADRLMAHGEHELAAEVLDDVQRQMSRYGNWGVDQTVMDVGMRQIAVAGELGGCDAAEEQADQLRQLPVVDFYSDAEDVIQLAVDRACA